MEELEERYLQEVDPDRREELLEALVAEQGETEMNQLRRQLFDARFAGRQQDGTRPDRFIRALTRLSFYRGRTPGRVFGRRGAERDFAAAAADLMADFDGGGSPAQTAALREELYNAVLRYRVISEEDPRYGSLAGLVMARGEAKRKRIREDLEEICIRIPERYGHGGEMIFIMLKEETQKVIQED